MEIYNKAVPTVNAQVLEHNQALLQQVDTGEITMDQCLAQSVTKIPYAVQRGPFLCWICSQIIYKQKHIRCFGLNMYFEPFSFSFPFCQKWFQMSSVFPNESYLPA